MKKRKIAAIPALLLLVFLGMQLVQPRPSRPVLPGDGPMTDYVSVPKDVEALLRQACYDCHSADTRWPWYSHIAPMSWLIAHDVQDGLSNLDFSRWSTDPVREPTPTQRLTWICRELREDKMPPWMYRMAHPEARLGEAQKERICAWSDEALERIDASDAATGDSPP